MLPLSIGIAPILGVSNEKVEGIPRKEAEFYRFMFQCGERTPIVEVKNQDDERSSPYLRLID